RFQRIDLDEVCPEPRLPLEALLQRLDLTFAPLLELDVVTSIVLGWCRMRAVILLRPAFHALRLPRSVTQDDATPAQPFVDHRPLFRGNGSSGADPILVVRRALYGLRQRTHGFRLRPQNPLWLAVTDGEWCDGLRFA